MYGQPMMHPGYGQPMMQPGYGQPMMGMPPPPPPGITGGPVMVQPGMPGMPMRRAKMPFMTMPDVVPQGMFPPLVYLQQLDHLFIRQCVEPFEQLTGIETANAYQVFSNGQMIYWAQEHSDFCERQCCGNKRPFVLTIMDGYSTEVMRMVRPYRCSGCCCFCCMQKLMVEAPPGRPVGEVKELCAVCTADYALMDATGKPVLRIDGPCCRCGHVEFKVRSLDGNEVGKVTKHWAGMLQEAMTDADLFGISFPVNLPVEMKAVILGSCFLIDFMYFEEPASGN